MFILFLLFGLLLPSSCRCHGASLPAVLTASPSPSLRASAKFASPVSALPSGTSTAAKKIGDYPSNDNGDFLPHVTNQRDAETLTSAPTLQPTEVLPVTSTMPTSPTTSNKMIGNIKDFKLYFTLYLSNITSEMNYTITEVFENVTRTFLAERIPFSPGVNADIHFVSVIGQLVISGNDPTASNKRASILQIDSVVSGSIALDSDVTNLTRIIVQNAIALTPFTYKDVLLKQLRAASSFFEPNKQILTSYDNNNDIPVHSVGERSSSSTVHVSKMMVVATAGAVMTILLLVLGALIAVHRRRRELMRRKQLGKLSDNFASTESNNEGQPPVNQIAPGDQASIASLDVASSLSGMSEIVCGGLRYPKQTRKDDGKIEKQYPIQERRGGSKTKRHTDIRLDQASHVSAMSDLLFDHWSMLSEVDGIEIADATKDRQDALVGMFIVESLGEDDESPACDLSSGRKAS